jgi:hypothetical protein
MWSLGCLITTNNQGTINAVKQILPSEGDPNVNIYDYYIDEGTKDGFDYLRCEIRFDLKPHRDDVLASIKGLSGIINACESPSYVRPHKCNGDSSGCGPEEGGIYK